MPYKELVKKINFIYEAKYIDVESKERIENFFPIAPLITITVMD